MGVYDFNIPRNSIDSIIAAMRNELCTIAVDSQTGIDNLKLQIAACERTLDKLKIQVDGLPDYEPQYEALRTELAKIKVDLQKLIDHPIILDYAVVEEG